MMSVMTGKTEWSDFRAIDVNASDLAAARVDSSTQTLFMRAKAFVRIFWWVGELGTWKHGDQAAKMRK